MKKRILTMILSALLLVNATACNVAENGTTGTSENTTTNATETTTTTTTTTTSTEPDPPNDPESEYPPLWEDDDPTLSETARKYRNTLYGFLNGYTTEFIYWPDLNVNALRFAIVDMTGDGFPEVIVEHYEDYAVFLTPQVVKSGNFRSMTHIFQDGTYSWTRQAGNLYGRSKLNYLGSQILEETELYAIENDGTDHTKFYVMGEEVSKEEFDQFGAQFSDEYVELYKLTKENIVKYITSDTFATE